MKTFHKYLRREEYSTIMSVNLDCLSANTVDSIGILLIVLVLVLVKVFLIYYKWFLSNLERETSWGSEIKIYLAAI